MEEFEWVKATAEDIPFLADRARESDKAELWATARITPEQAMVHGLKVSSLCCVGKVHGVPVCMFGAAPCYWSFNAGIAWMVGTDAIDNHPRAFLRGSRAAIDTMLAIYPLLCNFVDCRHTKAIRWLKALGATFQDAQPYGNAGLPFHFFEIRR